MAPEAAFSNVSEKNEFSKYCKFLAYKGVQVIVESRRGVKIEPGVHPETGEADWFNLQVPDTPEVNQAIKQALPSDRVLEILKSQLHVEISVLTEDGREMILELWTLQFDETDIDTTVRAMNTVYFRMGILLKSVVSISRIIPAYGLSRKQKTDSFVVYYRVYNGEPKLKEIESMKSHTFGVLKTPLGGLSYTVVFRSNFSLSPMKTVVSEKLPLLLKSDHFELSPKHMIYAHNQPREKVDRASRALDLNRPLRLAAFVDEGLIVRIFDEFHRRYPVPKCRGKRKRSPERPAAAESRSTQELDMTEVSRSPTSFEMPPKKFSGYRRGDEPPLKMLHFPFADNHPITELAEFYKDFFNAPNWRPSPEEVRRSTSKSSESLKEDVALDSDSVEKDLAQYENSVQEFDDLIADMCRSADWSGN